MIRADGFSFPWGQMIVKVVQIISLFLSAVMAGAWSSKGFNFTDLNEGDSNQGPYFQFLIAMAVLGMIWAIASIVLVFPFKQAIPPLVIIAVTGLLSLLLLISVALFIDGIVTLSNSALVQTQQLDVQVLEAACFFAIISLVAYIGDLVLEIIASVFVVRNFEFSKLYHSSIICSGDK